MSSKKLIHLPWQEIHEYNSRFVNFSYFLLTKLNIDDYQKILNFDDGGMNRLYRLKTIGFQLNTLKFETHKYDFSLIACITDCGKFKTKGS